MKTLSIIIPVYNEEATLQELVEKVINVDLSTIGYNKEVILVND
jgi:glycosyltransferase involved in cell wall biosynthesis